MSRKILEEFINLYKSHPCLWQTKSKEYMIYTHDRQLREAAYKVLIQILKELEPEANEDIVVKKINNLRSSVRTEKKKYESSLKSGASADDVYRPRLWYYDMMSFLSDQDTPRESTSNLDIQEEGIYEVGEIIHSHCLNFNTNFKKIVLQCIIKKETFYLIKKRQ